MHTTQIHGNEKLFSTDQRVMDEPVEDDKHGYESEFESTTGSVVADSLHSSETGHSPRGIVG